MNASISVVIRTFNSERTLEKVLAALDRKTEDQIIVVDSGSRDKTLEIARRFDCEILEIPRSSFTYGRALNIGFKAARTEWILALSSHCIPLIPGYVDAYRSALARLSPETGCALAPMVYCKEDWAMRSGISYFSSAELRHHIPGGNTNALYRKSVWLRHPFDESLPGAEDHEWILWATEHGLGVAMIHSVPVLYRPNRSLKISFLKGRWDQSGNQSAAKTTLKFRHDPLWWLSQTLCKVILGKIDIKTFLHMVAQRLGTVTSRWFKK